MSKKITLTIEEMKAKGLQFSSAPIDYRGDLVDVVTGYTQCMKNFIGYCVLPPVATQTCRFNWNLFNLTDGMEVVNADVVDSSRVHEVDNISATLQVGELEDKGLDVKMTWCQMQAASAQCAGVPDDIEVQEANRLASLVKLGIEKTIATLVLLESAYTANTTDAFNAQAGNLIDLATISGGNHQFNGSAPYDPLDLLTRLIASLPWTINYMATNAQIMAYLRTHPAFIANNATSVTVADQQIAATLGLAGICVGNAFSQLSGTFTKLWGNYILLFARTDQTSTECKVPTFGFTAKMPEQGSVDNMYVAEYFSWAHGLKGTTFMRTGEMIKPVVAHRELAILIKNPLV
ncbi:MAG TPA: hypothetical protein PLO52_00310 [Flavobacterium alvei]|nr:hypothetical protein [Flavobacterium alvei]